MPTPTDLTDIFLSDSELGTLFQSTTWSVLELDPADLASSYAVRLAWPTMGAPSWKHTETVTFLRITEIDNPINKQRDTRYAAYSDEYLNQLTETSRVLNVTWVTYGPDSGLWVQKIRERLFYQEFHDLLRAEQVFAVPDVRAPQRIPELFQGQWWERWDLTITCNEFVRRNWLLRNLESAPVTIKREPPAADIVADVAELTVVHDE